LLGYVRRCSQAERAAVFDFAETAFVKASIGNGQGDEIVVDMPRVRGKYGNSSTNDIPKPAGLFLKNPGGIGQSFAKKKVDRFRRIAYTIRCLFENFIPRLCQTANSVVGKWLAAQKGVGRICEVWQIIFSNCLEHPGISAGGIINPVISLGVFQPFVGMCPLSTLAFGTDYFAVEVEMQNIFIRGNLGKYTTGHGKTHLLVTAIPHFLQGQLVFLGYERCIH